MTLTYLLVALTKIGFQKSWSDTAVFYRHGEKDFAILGKIKLDLMEIFKMKDLGKIHWLLNLKIERDNNSRLISFSQEAYIDKILNHFYLEGSKIHITPLDPNVKLTKDQCPHTQEQLTMAKIPYREVIGSLMWAAITTRLNIAFAVSLLSQFLENPGEFHWKAMKRVLSYLKWTKNYKLSLGWNKNGWLGYTYADWVSQDHRHLILAYIFQIYGGSISWSCQKQIIVALSLTEAEFITLTHATKEALWLHHFITETFQLLQCPIKLYSDNQSLSHIGINNTWGPNILTYDSILYMIQSRMVKSPSNISWPIKC